MDLYSRCHCPECKRWVPPDRMNYFDGLRVCDWCLDQVPFDSDQFVYDPNFGKVQCIMCDSYGTQELSKNKYKCRECGEEFIL